MSPLGRSAGVASTTTKTGADFKSLLEMMESHIKAGDQLLENADLHFQAEALEGVLVKLEAKRRQMVACLETLKTDFRKACDEFDSFVKRIQGTANSNTYANTLKHMSASVESTKTRILTVKHRGRVTDMEVDIAQVGKEIQEVLQRKSQMKRLQGMKEKWAQMKEL